jgi:ABC-type nitrate/sulfonate/bicarbonate transport system substrate-binding protein
LRYSGTTRRNFLKLVCAGAGLASVSSLLQACGGSSAASPAASAPASTPASAPASKPAPAASAPASKPAASNASSAAASPAASKPAASAIARPDGGLRVAYPVLAATMSPVWIAADTNAFQQAGVSVNSQFVASNNSIFALAAKELEIVIISSAPVITADLAGQDLVFVGSCLNHPTFAMYSQPNIKSAADLKGKTVAADKPGTPADYAVRRVLSDLGLKPTDVNILGLGGSEVTYQALLSNQVQAALMSPPESFSAEDKGYFMLKDTFSIPYQNNGVVMSKARLDELASLIPKFLNGLRQGMLTFNSQPAVAMNVIKKYTKVDDEKILKRTYEFHRTSAPWELSLQPNIEGLSTMLDFMGGTVPAAKQAKAEQFVDLRFLAQLPKA